MCALELPALKSPMTKLEIRGHTDSKGPGREEEAKEYNRRLSVFRARNTRQAIKDILNDSLGVLDANFTANGYGWDEAVKAGEKNFRNLDRRKVEILLDGHLVLTLYDGKW
jgi:outer membrane protein OmpA-like peptidoglycan-associated protein